MNDRNNYRGGSRGGSNEGGQRRSYGSGGPRGSSGGQGPRRSFNDGPREMHKATCADCGKECEVPFRPAEGRPVYCNDCFPKHRKPRY